MISKIRLNTDITHFAAQKSALSWCCTVLTLVKLCICYRTIVFTNSLNVFDGSSSKTLTVLCLKIMLLTASHKNKTYTKCTTSAFGTVINQRLNIYG